MAAINLDDYAYINYTSSFTDSLGRNILNHIKSILNGIVLVDPAPPHIFQIDLDEKNPNSITSKFIECYKYLIEVYYNDSVYRQEVMQHGSPNIDLKVPVPKLHIKIMAMIYLSYLTELYGMIILYTHVYKEHTLLPAIKYTVNNTDSRGIYLLTEDKWNLYNAPGTNKNTQPTVDDVKKKHLALSLWEDNSESTKYKLHKNTTRDALSFTKIGGEYVFCSKINDLCTELDKLLTGFMKNMVIAITTTSHVSLDEILRIILYVPPAGEVNRWKHLHTNWYEKLQVHIDFDHINNGIFYAFDLLSLGGGNTYTTDSWSMFSWMYLYRTNSHINYANCAGATILEQFIFSNIYYPHDLFNISLQSPDKKNIHLFYRKIRSEYTISDNYAHWYTTYKTLVLEDTKHFRKVPDAIGGANHIHINIQQEPTKYLISTVLTSFTNYDVFLIKNKCIIDGYLIDPTLDHIGYFDMMTYYLNKHFNNFTKILKEYERTTTINMNRSVRNEPMYNDIDNQISNILQLNNLSDIVNFITTNNVLDILIREQNIDKSEIDPSVINEDKNEFLKSISTDFITETFFSNFELLFNFLNLVVSSLNTSMQRYYDILRIRHNNMINPDFKHYFKVLYKGGNALRIIFFEQIKLFPKDFKNSKEEVKKYFKRSDNDFAIYVNIDDITNVPAEKNKIFDELSLITYYVLNRIRNVYITELSKYTNYYTLNEYQKKTFMKKKLLDKINTEKLTSPVYRDRNFIRIELDDIFINTFDGDFNKYITDNNMRYKENKDVQSSMGSIAGYNGRRDFLITKDPITNNTVLNGIAFLHEKNNILPIDAQYQTYLYKNIFASNFYTYINLSIPHFRLIRTKVNIKAFVHDPTPIANSVKAVNIPGEFIDVAIPIDTTEFFTHINEFCKEYTLINEENTQLQFFSYSLKYYIFDLIKMIWFLNIEQNNVQNGQSLLQQRDACFGMPWFTKMKRLNRLFLLLLLHISKNREDVDYLTKIENFVSLFETLLNNYIIMITEKNNNITNDKTPENYVRIQEIIDYNIRHTYDFFRTPTNNDLFISIVKLIPKYIESYYRHLKLFKNILSIAPPDLDEAINQNFINRDSNISNDPNYPVIFQDTKIRDTVIKEVCMHHNLEKLKAFNAQFIDSLKIMNQYCVYVRDICMSNTCRITDIRSGAAPQRTTSELNITN